MKQILLSMLMIVFVFLLFSSLYGEITGPFWILFFSKTTSLLSSFLFFLTLCGLTHHASLQRERGIPLLYLSLGIPLRYLLKIPFLLAVICSMVSILGENIAFPEIQTNLQMHFDKNEIAPDEAPLSLDFGTLYKEKEKVVVLGEDWVLTAKKMSWVDTLRFENAVFYNQKGVRFSADSVQLSNPKPQLVKAFYRESSLSWALQEKAMNKELYKRTSIPLSFLFLCLLIYRLVLQYSHSSFFVLGAVLLLWVSVRVGDQLLSWGAFPAALFPLFVIVSLFILSLFFWRDG